MSANALAVRFTDETYATKADVVKVLGTSLVDSIWRNILAYRAQSINKLGLKTIPQLPFYLTNNSAISTKINSFGVKLTQFMVAYGQLPTTSKVKEEVDRYAKLNILRSACLLEDVKITDLSLKAMLNGTYREANPTHQAILAYRDAIAELQKHSLQSLDENLLASIYGTLLGETELTSFYRVIDPDQGSLYRTIVIARDYDFAPYADIPDLMDGLLDFLNNDRIDSVVKASMALYFLDYVKPFSSHNQTMGALLAKYVLAAANLSEVSALIPLEQAIVKTDRYQKLALETQRSGDLTYIVLYLIETLDPLIEDLFQEIKRAQADVMESERTPVTPQDKGFKDSGDVVRPEQESLFEEETKAEVPLQEKFTAPKIQVLPKETIVAVAQPIPSPAPVVVPVKPNPAPVIVPVSIPEPPKANPQPVIVAPIPAPVSAPVPAPVVSPTVPEPVIQETVQPEITKPSPDVTLPITPVAPIITPRPEAPKKVVLAAKKIESLDEAKGAGELALTVSGPGLSDKEIKEYSRYIIETNPNIRKPQAVFFAEHSVVGRYYTIQDYKRTIRCAYETARTSMDNLAAEGFYKKLQVKNKFVYTPIKQGENK